MATRQLDPDRLSQRELLDGAVVDPPRQRAPETAMSAGVLTDDDVRRWLLSYGEPAKLPDSELLGLLEAHGRMPANPTAAAIGDALKGLLEQGIERLRKEEGAPHRVRLPYLVLHTRFVQGVKWASTAERIGISQRQLTREQARAISLLRDELTVLPRAPKSVPRFNPERIPAIAGFLPRAAATRQLSGLLAQHGLVLVHGARGLGKTSLVAELAADTARQHPVFWFRFRAGVNASLIGLSFELGEYLRQHEKPALAEYLADALPKPDLGIVTRLAIRDLADSRQLLVLDDYHLADADPAIASFVDEAIARLPELRIVAVGRHNRRVPEGAASYPLPPLTRLETKTLLAQLDVTVDTVLADSIHEWTEGLPHLVTLGAAWLKTATKAEVAAGVGSLSKQEEVQDFLLDAITEVLDSADRSILDAASAFRDRFTDEALAYVAEQTIGAVEDASRRLVRRHLASRSRQGDVAFFHASVREYFYARLSPERRQQLEGRIEAWYARQAPSQKPAAPSAARAKRTAATRP